MRIYLDIDGVLLTKKHKLPSHVRELIKFVVERYDCYWLTTHCRNGENRSVEYLANFFSVEDLVLLRKVKATNWNTLKTEGIDFNSDFVWLEDYPFESEKKVLVHYDKVDNLIEVDLQRSEELKEVIKQIKKLEEKWQLNSFK